MSPQFIGWQNRWYQITSSNTSGALILYHVRGMRIFLQRFISESGDYRASGESVFRGFLQYCAGHSSVPGVFLWSSSAIALGRALGYGAGRYNTIMIE